MSAAQSGSRRRAPWWPVPLLLGVALLVVTVGGWLYADRAFVRFTPFEQDAGDLLRQIVADSGLSVRQTSAVNRLAAEGTQPDTAMQTLATHATANAVRVGFRQACRRAGLGAADAITLASDPDAICQGDWQGGSASVSVKLRCARTCRADVSVYHLWS